MKFGGNVKQEASISCKPFNIAFIAGVNKDWGTMVPVLVVYEVLLVEYFRALGQEIEVVQKLREIIGFVWCFWFYSLVLFLE